MSEKEKIALAITISFFIVFSVLFIFNSSFGIPRSETNKDVKNDPFFSKTFESNKNKIFLIGSSHMGMLNGTYINKEIYKKNSSYEVYNLAINGDHPSSRYSLLSKTILLHPKIVIYGLSYRDISNQDDDISRPVLPDIKSTIQEFAINQNIVYEPINPLLITYGIFYTIQNKTEIKSDLTIEKNPFIEYNIEDSKIKSEIQLTQSNSNPDIHRIDKSSKNMELVFLKKTIYEFQKNNIKVILLIAPLHHSYLDKIPKDSKDNFNQIITQLQDEFHLEVYDFTQRYSYLHIWTDESHVAINENSLIFSNDVIELILKEID